jgi:hypothetical protein
MCALCEAGLKPVPGLNDDLVCELEGFLNRGSHDAGRRVGESVLGHAARIVRENRTNVLERVAQDSTPTLLPEQVAALRIARERGIVHAGENGVTSDTLEELYDLGLVELAGFLDNKTVSAVPREDFVQECERRL